MSEDSGQIVLVELAVSDPVETEPGCFQTLLTHPNLTGALILRHGQERDSLLRAIGVDLKQLNPVETLFRHLGELRKSL
jgi:hypothetical protein